MLGRIYVEIGDNFPFKNSNQEIRLKKTKWQQQQNKHCFMIDSKTN